jgi:hypothetical protein
MSGALDTRLIFLHIPAHSRALDTLTLVKTGFLFLH